MSSPLSAMLLLLLTLVTIPLTSRSDPISRNVRVLVEDLSDEAQQCGVAESPLYDRVAFVLATARWTIDPSSTGYIYVRATVMLLSDNEHCVYGLVVEINRLLTTMGGRPLVAPTVTKGGLGISKRFNTSREVLEDTESFLKAAIGQAEADNL